MHRSGTSLVASVLQRAGLNIGRDLSGPGLGNPRGHFEDQDFFRLHEDMLAAAGESCFTVKDNFAPPADPEFGRRARRLAAERDALPLWGWKDPRTCLFFELWEPILPAARYLLLYRHPIDVALSLWRRNKDLELRQDPRLAIRAWEVYNRHLLDFYHRHPERCFLAHLPALATDFDGLLRRLRTKLGVPLNDDHAGSVFIPEELTPPTPPNPVWGERIPGALALYHELEASADLPARNVPSLASPLPPRERELLRASETLLHVLLERNGAGGSTPPLELRQAYYDWREREEDHARIRELEAALSHVQAELQEERQRLEEERQRLEEERARSVRAEEDGGIVIRVLREIESSRSFAPVRAWWRLRRRLRKPRA
jgi:hypothetical protein